MNDTAPAQMGDNQPDLATMLREDHADLITRRDGLHAAVERVPETVDDEQTAKDVTDFIKQIQACIKRANAKRVDTKEPFLEGGRQVDGFFKAITDPLGADKKEIERRLTVYQQARAAEERRRREEQARLDREAAEAAASEAAAREAALQSEEDLPAAVQAEIDAELAAEAARKSQREADAKAADMSRDRGEFGGVASLRTYWTFEFTDYAHIDLEVLRAHLPRGAVEQAMRSFIKADGREITGARIFEETQSVVR